MATSGGLVPGSSSDPVLGQTLAQLSYNSVGGTTYTTTSTTIVAIDTTNLAITFTAPPSGQVWVEFEGALLVAASKNIYFGLISAGSQIGPATVMLGAFAELDRITGKLLITSLTPGASYTFQLAWFVTTGGTATMYNGVSGNNGPTNMLVKAA